MVDTTHPDEVTALQRETWETFASGWEKWDDLVQATQGPVGEAIVASLAVSEDQVHLDIASGTGEPGLTVAARAPRGRVVLTDLSPAMLAAARRRAASLGLTNVETQECAADDLPYKDNSFDSVSCRFGFMFFPDIPRAVAELTRVLRPGGWLCTAVWAEADANPWATIAGEAIATEVAVPPAPPGAPGMYRCAAPGMISAELRSAGLRQVREWDVPIVLAPESPQQYWQLVTECTAPVVAVLSQVDEETRRRIAAVAIDKASSYAGPNGLHLPGTARCIAGQK
jgi:ubiquinone/menaquinone biosynthesis C-methylase UbiE